MQHLCYLPPACLQRCFPASSVFPMALRHVPASLHWRPGQVSSSATALRPQHLSTALRPATNLIRRRRSPVWLAIWRIWAGFANSQHRDAAYAASNNICAHFPSLPHRVAAQTDANLSAHLHRLPTPPPYLRPMRLLHGRCAGIRCWMRLSPGWGASIRWVIRLALGQGRISRYQSVSFYITFFNILQQKALRSAYQEPSVCVQSFS